MVSRVRRTAPPPPLESPACRFERYLAYFKSRYHGLDIPIDLLGMTLVAGENILLVGEPGLAKTKLCAEFITGIQGAKAYQMQFREGVSFEDLFGSLNHKRWRDDGVIEFEFSNSLVDSHLALLDEMFDATPRILRVLLSVLNERKVHYGRRTLDSQLEMIAATSNYIRKMEELRAVMDRFLLSFSFSASPKLVSVLQSEAANQEFAPPVLSLLDVQALRQVPTERPVSDVWLGRSLEDVAKKTRGELTVSPRRAVRIKHLLQRRIPGVNALGLLPYCLGELDIAGRLVQMVEIFGREGGES